MNHALVVLLLGALLWGCDNRASDLEKQNAELQQRNSELERDISTRDEYVDDITETINKVYDELEVARAKEKAIIAEKSELETVRKLSRAQIRERLLGRITLIDSTLKDNRRRIDDLQAKLKSSRAQYSGLQKMVASLKKTIEEREQSIAALEERVRGLEQDVAVKSQMISERDSVIDQQKNRLTTAYYVVGTRDELQRKGIIRKSGGFLWGLLGSTTILSNGFDEREFRAINRLEENSILVNGRISEIVPNRNEQFYSMTAVSRDRSTIDIADPEHFWQDKYLVIITD